MRKQSLLVLLLSVVVVLAVTVSVNAQQSDKPKATASPLVRLLQSKGILTAEEVAEVSQASTSGEADLRLAQLLFTKGVISKEDYDQAVGGSVVSVSTGGSNGATLVPAVLRTPVGSPGLGTSVPVPGKPPAAKEPPVIPAIVPVRVLPIGIPRDPKGIIPDIKLGSGAMLNLYGFLKASAVYDSTNSGGGTFGNNDFPLPLLLGDTGPDNGSQFHIKARSARAGANFAWPINGPNFTLTGKLEFDWEGDYTAANNRNISSVRSSQASIRLAWMRLDAKLGEVPWFFAVGQDWTLLGSSSLPDIYETTGLGVGFGSFYERLPQIKSGVQFHTGSLKIQPEFAITLGGFGDNNLNSSVTNSLFGALGQIPTGQQNQLREGAILGSASGQPGVQGRIVFDFPLNKSWKGVANAELIVSGGHAQASEIVPSGNIPATLVPSLTYCSPVTPPVAGFAGCSVRGLFPTGLRTDIPQNAFSAEFQFPLPWVTVVGKVYRGGDLRFYFAGQLNTAFADTSAGPVVSIPGGVSSVLCTFGTTGCVGGSAALPGPPVVPAVPGTASLALTQPVLSLSGDPISFTRVACASCAITGLTTAQLAPLRPIRGQGGFIQLSFPLSRIFGADPEGRNNGWSYHIGIGVDSAVNRDVVRSGGNSLLRSDYISNSLRYKINKWATIVNEVTYYDTRLGTAPGEGVGIPRTVLFRGVPSRVNHDWRNEFGTIFTF
jgi:hypothetical protein